MRGEFLGLVRRVVGIDLLLAQRERGEPLDPILAWHALAQDQTTGWAYAEAFRAVLGLEIPELMPKGPAETDTSASSRELRESSWAERLWISCSSGAGGRNPRR